MQELLEHESKTDVVFFLVETNKLYIFVPALVCDSHHEGSD